MNPNPSPSDVAREWFQKVWNDRDESAIDRLLSPETGIDSLHFEDMTVLRGPEQFKPFHKAMLSAIPDLHVTISKLIEHGDWVSVRFVCQGTHTGPGLGFEPHAPPSSSPPRPWVASKTASGSKAGRSWTSPPSKSRRMGRCGSRGWGEVKSD